MQRIQHVACFVLHHSESHANKTLEQLRKEHRARGMDDIGYHWIIRNGRAEAGRPMGFQGAHVKVEWRDKSGEVIHSWGRNRDTLGIALVGNYLLEPPPEEQVEACAQLLDGLSGIYGQLPIYAHRDVEEAIAKRFLADWGPTLDITDCPGSFPWVEQVRKQLGWGTPA